MIIKMQMALLPCTGSALNLIVSRLSKVDRGFWIWNKSCLALLSKFPDSIDTTNRWDKTPLFAAYNTNNRLCWQFLVRQRAKRRFFTWFIAKNAKIDIIGSFQIYAIINLRICFWKIAKNSSSSTFANLTNHFDERSRNSPALNSIKSTEQQFVGNSSSWIVF